VGLFKDRCATVAALAEWLGTISYEVLTLPGGTWERVAAAGEEGA